MSLKATAIPQDACAWMQVRQLAGKATRAKSLALAAAALMGAIISMHGASAQTIIRINITSPSDSHLGAAINTFGDEVEKRTDGRYKVQRFYSGALGSEREAVEAVQLGAQEMVFTSTGPIPNFVPEVKILDLPFLFRDYQHARHTLDGPVGQELLKKFEDRGFKALAWGENGFRHMTNNKHPIKQPEDLRGLKMRTMENPVHIQAYKGFGIIPTPMAFSEVFTALQQGTVDGQENPLSIITSNKFDQVQKYLTLTGHVYSPSVFLINKALYDKMSDVDKQAFLEAAREGVKANRARVDADERSAVAYLRSKGMDVVEQIDKSKFQAALAPVYREFEKQLGADNIARIRNVQ